MLIEKLKTDFEFKDERGTLVQLVHCGYSQVNIITSKAGGIRGGHYHELNAEAFYLISGKCRVTARREGIKETKEFVSGDFFGVGANIIHDFEYLEDSVLISLYTKGVELGDGKMDIIVSHNNMED